MPSISPSSTRSPDHSRTTPDACAARSPDDGSAPSESATGPRAGDSPAGRWRPAAGAVHCPGHRQVVPLPGDAAAAVYSAQIHPSHYRLAIHLLPGLCSLLTLLQLPWPGPVAPLAICLAGFAGLWLYRRDRSIQHLLHQQDGGWSWYHRGHWHHGYLTAGCYRCPWLVVLAVVGHKGHREHLCLWRDALTPREFSYLQLQLALLEPDELAS